MVPAPTPTGSGDHHRGARTGDPPVSGGDPGSGVDPTRPRTPPLGSAAQPASHRIRTAEPHRAQRRGDPSTPYLAQTPPVPEHRAHMIGDLPRRASATPARHTEAVTGGVRACAPTERGPCRPNPPPTRAGAALPHVLPCAGGLNLPSPRQRDGPRVPDPASFASRVLMRARAVSSSSCNPTIRAAASRVIPSSNNARNRAASSNWRRE